MHHKYWNESQTLNSEDLLFKLLSLGGDCRAVGVLGKVCVESRSWGHWTVREPQECSTLGTAGRQQLIKRGGTTSKANFTFLKILLRTNHHNFLNSLFCTSKEMLRHFLLSIQLHRFPSWSGTITSVEYVSQHCVIGLSQLCQGAEGVFHENNFEQWFSKSFPDQQQRLAQGSVNIFCEEPE